MKTIYHPYGLKAEVSIEPGRIEENSEAKQTIEIFVDKTCESITGWCRSNSENGWVTFDSKARFRHFFDPQQHSGGFWSRHVLPKIVSVIAITSGIETPQEDPETVTVKLEAADESKRSVYGTPDAIFKLVLG